MDAFSAVVGIDVSKKKLDVALLVDGKIKSKVIDNSAQGHQALLDWLKKHNMEPMTLHACMEAPTTLATGGDHDIHGSLVSDQ